MKTMLLFGLLLLALRGNSQQFKVCYDGAKSDCSSLDATGAILKSSDYYYFTASGLDSKQIEVLIDDVVTRTQFTDGDNEKSFVISGSRIQELRGSVLKFTEAENRNKVLVKVVFPKGDSKTFVERTAREWVLKQYDQVLEFRQYGLVLTDERTAQSKNLPFGPDVVHIFLDGFGNSILTAIPQGISNMQYVIHIVHRPKKTEGALNESYSINQRKGFFSANLVLRNTGIVQDLSTLTSGGIGSPKSEWAEEIILLRTSSDDIEFDIVKSKREEGTTGVIATQIIPMSSVYNASFEVGLLRSNLENPSFSLAPLPTDPTKNTVVAKETGPRGRVTIMATLYTSPILIVRYLIQRIAGRGITIPSFQLYGRSFLLDHEWYERLYPAFGVSLNDNVFENLFYGVDFEFARGASLFIGGHYGKVNTFDTSGGIIVGASEVTQEDFGVRSNTEWKTDLAFGINLDVTIIKNLFKL